MYTNNFLRCPAKWNKICGEAQMRMPIVVISRLWDTHMHSQWHAHTEKGAMLCEL